MTLSATGARMYINGVLAVESATITTSSLDFKPILNYIGRSQFSDPLFNGNIDDFRVYNYALSAAEIAQVSGIISGINDVEYNKSCLSLSPVPAKDMVHITYSSEKNAGNSTLSVHDLNGRLVLIQDMKQANNEAELNVSNLPAGIYMLKLTNSEESVTKKLLINH